MRYGERLQLAMDERSKTLGRKVTRLQVAEAGGVSRQNIGMIITGAQGNDQKLNTEANHRVAAFLRVNAHWLATGEGHMLTGVAPEPAPVSFEAKQLDLLLQSIPESRRLQAYQAATQLLISHLGPLPSAATGPSTTEAPALRDRTATPSASHHR